MPTKKINTRINYKRRGYNSKKMGGGKNNENDGNYYQGFLPVYIVEACKEWYKLTQFYKKADNEEKIKQNEKVRIIVNKIKGLISVEAPEMTALKNSLLGIEGVTEEKINKKLTDLQSRLGQKEKENDLYKVQTFGELLEYQARFCPAGFHNNLKKLIQNHESSFLSPETKNSLSSLYSKLKGQGKIIFSNEALSDSFLPVGQKAEYKLQDVDNEYFSVFHSNEFTGTEDGTHWYVEDKTNNKKYYTAHYSSLADRKDASNEWCENLSTLLDNLNNDDSFGGFAGDINLYVTKNPYDESFDLRAGVAEALEEHNCTLTIPFHLLNKDAFRNEINDQWHKVGKSALEKEARGNQEVAKPTLDSLVIIEPYVDGFKYNELANEFHQVFFLPNKTKIKPEEETQEVKQPFNWKDGTVTDHFLVVGSKLAIYSGADIHGKGNKAKKTTHHEGNNMNLYEGNEKLLEIINRCIELVRSLTPGNVKLLTNKFNRMFAGTRKVKKSRKKRGRKSKRGSRRN